MVNFSLSICENDVKWFWDTEIRNVGTQISAKQHVFIIRQSQAVTQFFQTPCFQSSCLVLLRLWQTVTVATHSSMADEIQLQVSLKKSSRNSCLLVTVALLHAQEATIQELSLIINIEKVGFPPDQCYTLSERPTKQRLASFRSAVITAFQKQICHLVIYKAVFGMNEGFRAQPKWLRVWRLLFLLSSLDDNLGLCRVA